MANMADRRVKMLMMVSYYGTGFVGWQRQSAASTGGKLMVSVQDVIENAVTTIFRPNERINVTSVSRTDSGTHALQQYCTFTLENGVEESMQELLGKINAVLPDSVLAQSLVVLNPEMAKWRTKSKFKKYVYYIQQGKRPIHDISPYTWYLSKQLNLAKLREALNLITGTHDFRTFSQGLQKEVFLDLNTKRTIIDCKVIPRRHTDIDFTLNLATAGTGTTLEKDPEDLSENYVVCIEITGNGFLRHMVRRIVGTLRSVGEGRCEPDFMTQVLVGNAEPGPSVPARGLWLHRSWMTQQEYDDEMKF